MKLPHDKFCVLPWVSLESSPNSTVRPCCLADDEIVDDTDNTQLLDTFWRKTHELDAIRKESCLDVIPELRALI
jgi:hypothetical protein